MDLINELKAAKAAGKTDSQLATAQDFQRKAQFYLDFVEAENSTGFHAPQEAARILGESINFSRQGQIVLRDGKVPVSSAPAGKKINRSVTALQSRKDVNAAVAFGVRMKVDF